MSKTTITFRTDIERRDALDSLAESQQRNRSFLINEAIENYIAEQNSVEAEIALLKRRWKAYELTDETISQDEMTGWAESLRKDPA